MKVSILIPLIISLFFIAVSSEDNSGPVIKTTQGEIQGTWKTTINGRKIQAFMGIPYAKPPVGPLRFKNPKPFGNWTTVLDGTRDPSVCPQSSVFLGLRSGIVGKEDCLYLNVYTPDASQETKYPVMVFFHGGGFFLGGGLSLFYGPDMLLDKDIVLVVPNYRLGILGFGSTEDKEYPGNIGLKDQVLVLKWVQENIAAYGGNPDSVTIFGQSAGGVCVHYHMLSPLSQGLFHRAIPMSGTAFNSWSISAPGKVANFVSKFGEKLNCSNSSTKELMDCLSDTPVALLVTTASDFAIWEGKDPRILFTPVLEPESEESFITNNSYHSYTTVPMMTGVTTEEGTYRIAAFYYSQVPIDQILAQLDENFDKIGPVTLAIDDKVDNPGEVAKQIKQFFFGENPINQNTTSELVKMYSDVLFYEGEKLALKRHNGTAFLYLFAFNGPFSFAGKLSQGKFKYGVSHCDDLQYLFPLKGMTDRNSSFSEEEKRISQQFVEYIVNFATHGNPTPDGKPLEWTPTTIDDFNYLLINGTDSIQSGFMSERDNFWKNISWLRKVVPESEW